MIKEAHKRAQEETYAAFMAQMAREEAEYGLDDELSEGEDDEDDLEFD